MLSTKGKEINLSLNKELVDEIVKNDSRYKGYIYDSLVYRYIRAREGMAERDARIDKEHDISWHKAAADRDMLRFCQILNEAIGEHD